MNEPTDGLQSYQSIKVVLAGKITEVTTAGCYVQNADGTSALRTYPSGMIVRYKPTVGDYWVVYEPDGYESISPRLRFEEGYLASPDVP